MTSLDKPAMSTTTSRKVSPTEPIRDIPGRQEFASRGNDMPIKETNEQQGDEVSRSKALSKALQSIARYAGTLDRKLEFQVDQQLHETVVTVLDKETGEVIRQIPSEEMLELARHFSEPQSVNTSFESKGLLLDKDA